MSTERMGRSLQNYFLAPGSAFNLGFSRFLFYGWFLWQAIFYDLADYANIPPEYWSPVTVLRPFSAPTYELMVWVVLILYVTTALACLGLFTRTTCWLTAFLGIYAFGVAGSYGDIRFHFAPMIIIACILPLSPCGDAFSIDRLLSRRKPKTDPSDYTWPMRLSQITLIALMFTAGYQKLAGNWLSQPIKNIEHWIHYKYFVQAKEKGYTLPEILLEIPQYDWLMFVMAVTLLVSEVLCPLALLTVWPKVRIFLVSLLFAMQLSLAVVFKTLKTFPWLGAYFFFVPWESLVKKLRNKVS
jgi:hypothetical protein